ncbi:Pcmt1-prov protein [Pluteus cervinus]|uniref:Pcmt1-prov protein n=1 Tax=Pluteus cervinus TaxID=181527 RepID=A0ACD3B629_9AGAR|nr:Pcmt1-prov protein [Pluteus cervinus]
MAWRCSGSSNKELISNMAQKGIAHSEHVAKAMSSVDRANYVRDRSSAYLDSPQSIGYGATISAPHMHAYASEHLLPYLHPGAKILDVGSGSGYLAAVFHHLVSPPAGGINSSPNTPSTLSAPTPKGKVVGIEHIPELVDWSKENLKADGLGEKIENGEIRIIVGDGRLGFPEEGPYDAIHVGAAAPSVPDALIAQLASPGRMFIPVGTYAQYVMHIDKDVNGNVTQSKVMGVSYVPLTDRESQSTRRK